MAGPARAPWPAQASTRAVFDLSFAHWRVASYLREQGERADPIPDAEAPEAAPEDADAPERLPA